MTYLSPAAHEARSLFHLIEGGSSTVEQVHALVRASPEEEKVSRAAGFTSALSFRRRVSREFDRLAASQHQSEQPQKQVMGESLEAVKHPGGMEVLAGVGIDVPACA